MNKQLNYAEIAAELRIENTFLKDTVEFTCEGTSMLPVMKEGDDILVRRTPVDQLWFGDLVTYEENGRFITHRFLFAWLKQNQEVLIVKPDNRLKFDNQLPISRLVGKVVRIFREGQTVEIETKSWRYASWMIGIMSLTEGLLYTALLTIKKILFKHLIVNPKVKKALFTFLQKPKELFSRTLLAFSVHQKPH